MKSVKAIALSVCATALLATGCGAVGSGGDAQEASRSALHVSRVKDYDSFAELRQDSIAAVKVTVKGNEEEALNEVPTSVTTVTVDEVLWGKSPAKSFPVLQLGRAGMDLEDTGAILVKGQRYILFVKPFHLKPGEATGLYQITGSQGVYRFDGEGGGYAFAGGGHPRLPERFTSHQADIVAR
ncbi:hypothetical protein [Streptomyces sp. PTY087I2]|uniref:hypothetical protein n=1 Tax=Streptomyces sp. PTY087I2 TaxID=1819298 RepID=UPI0008285055|nr:hypothetical protein [Streptomyces sp. PTY087I2]OCC09513.1 hypothetical protein A3Q37_04555 [Streptomyces sp. PTY087I2]